MEKDRVDSPEASPVVEDSPTPEEIVETPAVEKDRVDSPEASPVVEDSPTQKKLKS